MALEPMSITQYNDLVIRVRQAAYVFDGSTMPGFLAASIVDTVLCGTKIVAPLPKLDPDLCRSVLWDEGAGEWWQCDNDLGHDPKQGHDSGGDWSWPEGSELSITVSMED